MADNNTVKGGISVETSHIFPVIKKWLYSLLIFISYPTYSLYGVEKWVN